jgi:hypothetical protein
MSEEEMQKWVAIHEPFGAEKEQLNKWRLYSIYELFDAPKLI